MKQTKKREDKEKVNARSRKHRLTKTTKKLEIVGLNPDEIEKFLFLPDLETLSHADKLRHLIKSWKKKNDSKPEQIIINVEKVLPKKKIADTLNIKESKITVKSIKKSNNELSYEDEVNKILDAIELKKNLKNVKEIKLGIDYKNNSEFMALLYKVVKMAGVPRIKNYFLSNNSKISLDNLKHMIQFPEELQKRILKKAIQVNNYDRAILEFKDEIEILKKGRFKK